jgi:hypothetical protein
MTSKGSGTKMDAIADRAWERLEKLIEIMEKAADRVAAGGRLEEIDIVGYPLYMAIEDQGQDIICVWEAEDYFRLVEAAAFEAGVCLDDTEEISVQLPEAEFEDCMVTGGFMAWKGLCVERKNILLEELLECLCRRLKARGLNVNCIDDEDYIILSLPICG